MPKNNPAGYGDMNTLLDQLIANGYFDSSSENGVGAMKFIEGEMLRREAAQQAPQQAGGKVAQQAAPNSRTASAPMPPRRPASIDKQNAAPIDLNDPALYAEGMPSGPVHTVQLPNAQQVEIASNQQVPEQRTPIMDGFKGMIASVMQTLGQRNAANASTSPTQNASPIQSAPVAVKGPMLTPEMLEEQAAMAEGSEDALQQQRYGAKVEALNPVSRSMQKGIDEKAAKRGDKPPPANASWREQLRYNLRNTIGGGKKQDAKPSAR
jgi:hypothetical protein